MKKLLLTLALSISLSAFTQTIPFDEWWLNAQLTGIEVQYGLERKDYCGLCIRKLYSDEYKHIKWEIVNDKPFAIFCNHCGIDKIYVRLYDGYKSYIFTGENSRVFFAIYNQGEIQIPFAMESYEGIEHNLVDIDKEKYMYNGQ